MKEHLVNQLDNFIMGWYTDPILSDKLIKYYYDKKDFVVDKSTTYQGYKCVDTLFQDKDNLPLCNQYLDMLYSCTDKYRERYEWCDKNQSLWGIHEFMNIQMYDPGFSYNAWHAEMVGPPNLSSKRNLVFMTYLNNVENGGETEFLYQKLKIKPEKGLTLIWPVYWMHTHKGHPTNQKKFIATGWFEYKNNE